MNDEHQNICREEVFERIYRMYARDLRNFLLYKFQDVETCNDIVQECFVKLWEKCREIRFDKVKSFLFTVGNNAFINHKKHLQVVRKHHKQIKKPDIEPVSPEYVYIEEEYARKLHRLIDQLPEKQKTVFMMSRIEKLTYNEIAETLQISVKAVEKRMSAALRFLRTRLEYFR